ncbi:hypothetical protein H5410_004045 [Solanum commersonii]|uniref:Uncharacterized protein n=1 Tax=Solanum commersonii TaxID=4109 RepID=A0A9J6B6N3_SOLCO|nr:hypothetical protein H5410_004045 [Solanum commersonii]
MPNPCLTLSVSEVRQEATRLDMLTLLRWVKEIKRPENKGIASALNLLEESKKVIDSNFKGGPISYADLYQFTGTMF